MGAGKPELRPSKTEPPKPSPSALFRAAAFLVALALPAVIYFTWESPAPALSPQEEAKLEKRLREIDDPEQYALKAKIDGWYPCVHGECATYYLLAGEVWKYGVTSKGEAGRYSIEFLHKNKVVYTIQFKGNYAECLKQEQIKLFNYPYLPENMARPPAKRLPRPPYNRIRR